MVGIFLEDGKIAARGPAGSFAGRDRAINGDIIPDRRVQPLARKGHENVDILGVHPVIHFAIEDGRLLLIQQLAGSGNLSLLLLLKPKKIRVRWHPTKY
jgi:hypothetical protein